MGVFLRGCFDGGFAIEHGGDDKFEEEEFALPNQGFGEWEDFFDMLFGKDRATGGDSAY